MTAARSPNLPIPDNNAVGISDNIIIDQNISIEFVEINFTAADHTSWGNLQIELTSPSGTKSILAENHNIVNTTSYNNWIFGSVRHLGEYSQGTWKLTVKDMWKNDTGTFQKWGLRIYGTNLESDIIAPVINTVTLSNYTPNTGASITVTVNATDNTAVTGVTANGTALVFRGGNIWNGTITAQVGTHIVTVIASDAAGLTATNTSQSYTAITVTNGLTLTVDPTITQSAIIGTNATYTLNLTNTGTVTDSYVIGIVNDIGVNVGSLTTLVTLNSGNSSIISLNISSNTAGMYRVNVTATSVNDPTKYKSINTTTKVRDSGLGNFPGDTAAAQGGLLKTTVNVTNYGLTPKNYTILVSGVSSSGYPLVGTGTVFTMPPGVKSISVQVAVPLAAAEGNYILNAFLWNYEQFPVSSQLVSTSSSNLTVTIS